MDGSEAVVASLEINFKAVFITSLTTLVGFLGMNVSDSPPFRDLGNIVALGVAVAFALSVYFLPAVLAFLPIRGKISATSSSRDVATSAARKRFGNGGIPGPCRARRFDARLAGK